MQTDASAPLELLTDRPRLANHPASMATYGFAVEARVHLEAERLAHVYGTTLDRVLLAAVVALVHRHTGQDRFGIGAQMGDSPGRRVVRADVSASPGFGALLGRVRAACEDAGTDGQPSSVNVVWHTGGIVGAEPCGGEVTFVFWLEQAGLRGRVDYDEGLFDEVRIERMVGHLMRLLSEALVDPHRPVWQLGLLTRDEEQLLAGWNATETAYPTDVTIVALVERQAFATPERVAVTYEDQSLTYRQLMERSHQLARYLGDLGVGPETRVAVCLDRSPELVIALVAVTQAGGAPVPLDPSYPGERLRFVVADAQAPVLLTSSELIDRVPCGGARVVRLDADWPQIAEYPTGRPDVEIDADTAAYVIYTSGSTGRPKGVVNTHRGILNRLLWMQDTYALDGDDAVLQKTPIGFDVSVWEFWWPLITGSRVVLARPEGHKDPTYLAELIEAEQVTVAHFVPSMLQVFLDVAPLDRCGSLRQVVCSGEALTGDLVRRFRSTTLAAALDNLYGPTEAAIDVTRYRCDGDGDPVPIGAPIANTTVHVLDRHLQPVPIGVSGELYLGGVQLAREYLNRPDLTAERFVPDPASSVPGRRLYATGDLARWRADGNVEYLGRLDHQVKLRGFRIELGEIESALRRCNGIEEAVVLLRPTPAGEPQLVAYGVCRGSAPSAETLRGALGATLPDHMVPSSFVALDALPLSTHGKVDRAALARMSPATPAASAGGASRAAPRSEAERRVAAAWAEVLGRQEVGIDEDFFLSGGSSLAAIRLVAALKRELRVPLAVGDLFSAPTVASLAREVVEPRLAATVGTGDGRMNGAEPVRSQLRRRSEPQAPLTPAQRGLWFLHQMFPESHAYHVPVAYELCGPLDVRALSAALTEVVRRHETLRSTISLGPDGTETAVVRPVEPFDLAVTAVTGDSPAARRAEVERLAGERVRVPFDLGSGPLVRGELFRLAGEHHVLLLVFHHIVSDAWTLSIVADELSVLYASSARGRTGGPELPTLPVQFGDYARWHQETVTGEVVDRQLDYWKSQLAGLSLLALPTDRPRPATPAFEGHRVSTQVPVSVVRRLREVAAEAGATEFMVMVTGLMATLSRYADQDDVAIAAVIADRPRPELERLAGYFINTLVLRVDCGDDPPFMSLLRRLRDVAVEAYEHRDVPFERLVGSLAPGGDPRQPRLFNVAVSYLNTPPADLRLDGLTVSELEFQTGIARFELDVFMREHDGGIIVNIDYQRELFDEATVRWLLDFYVRLLTAAAADPQRPISGLPATAPAELAQLAGIGSHPVAHPSTPLVHECVSAWASRSPDAPAVRDACRTLTYGELDHRARLLAGHLRGAGVGADTIVGVMLDRSVDYAVALLAVLHAGGAYLPLDPSYPDERLEMMLEDSAAPLVLTNAHLVRRLPSSSTAVPVLVDRPRDGRPEPLPAVKAGQLAYVIYTSGSTGRPKGVLIEHRGLLNLCHWHAREYGLTPADRGTSVAAQGFDASVWELWPYLFAGASVSIADDATRTDPDAVARWLIAEDATVSFLPTPLAEAVLDGDLASRLPVRALLTGGDQLTRRPEPGLPFVLVNHYGPTECTVVVTAGLVEDRVQAQGPAHIGRPIDNIEVLILDENLKPLPRGARGELYLGGVGLARGYLNQAELTTERFVRNPYGSPGSRLYRTGDLARWRSDGTLEFLGRADRQVKVRGYRIEPGEIEACLREHPGVAQALVVPYSTVRGDQALAAYVLPAGPVVTESAELRRWLRQRLPAHMVPTACISRSEFPMTASGKLDRARLPSPLDHAVAEVEFVAPRDELEAAVAGLFEEMLGRTGVGVHDNFFDLGGQSLVAARLVARLRSELGMAVPTVTLFTNPTVAALSSALVDLATQEAGVSVGSSVEEAHNG